MTAPLRDVFRQLAGVIDGLNCGLVGRAPNGIVVFVNQRMLDWLGHAREEVVGRPVLDFVPEELHAIALEEMKAAEAGDLRVRLTALRRRDGTTFPALVVPQRYVDGQGRYGGGLSVVIELGSVQTARDLRQGRGSELRASLDRIALELQSLALVSAVPSGSTLPLGHPALAELSAREREVLARLVAGERVPTMAKGLCISQHTVRNHLKSLFRKLGAGSQSELIERVRGLGAPTVAGDAANDGDRAAGYCSRSS